MMSFDVNGRPLTHEKIVPGNTATGIGSEIYTYTERYLAYTSGGTTEIVADDWIVGATGGAFARVLKVVLSSGTWAGGDAAGYFIICSQHGTFQSENLKVAAGTNDATIAADSRLCMPDEYVNKEFRGKSAVTAVISVRAYDILFDVDGSKPDQTALIGHTLAAGGSMELVEIEDIKQFKCIDYTAESASTVNVTCYF